MIPISKLSQITSTRAVLAAALVAAGVAACSGGSLSCPPGTHADVGACVADTTCGPGTTEVGGVCLPATDAGSGLSCGPGTVDSAGVCLPAGSSSSSSASSSSGASSTSSSSSSSSSTSSSGGLPPGTVTVLGYEVVDAQYSPHLDKIAIASTGSNGLHVHDPRTGNDVAVTLPLPPTCVAVSPDGTKAAVGHDAYVSYVDLSAGTLIKTIAVSSDVAHIALTATHAYGIPRVDQWVGFDIVDLATLSEVTPSGSGTIWAGSIIRRNAAGDSLYLADWGLSPQTLYRYTVSGAGLSQADESPFGMYAPGVDFWTSDDGLRIFSASGVIFKTSSVSSMDLTYNGSFSMDQSVIWADSSAAAGKVAVIPGADDTKLHLYDNQFVQFQSSTPLPQFPTGGTSATSHGRYAFFKSDGSQVFVILQADPSAGALHDFAVTAM